MRILPYLVLPITALFFPLAATGVEFSLIGSDRLSVNQGETFTINLAFDNASGDLVGAVLADLSGLAGVATVTSGRSSPSGHFFTVCSDSACFGGIDTVRNAFFDPDDLSGGQYVPGDDSVRIVSALTLSPTMGTGVLDPGLDGTPGTPGARDVEITLLAQTVGVYSLQVGGEYSDGVTTFEIPGPSIELTVVPEPGSALLLGLGLAGLATLRRGE